jgi:hypothetical protein
MQSSKSTTKATQKRCEALLVTTNAVVQCDVDSMRGVSSSTREIAVVNDIRGTAEARQTSSEHSLGTTGAGLRRAQGTRVPSEPYSAACE